MPPAPRSPTMFTCCLRVVLVNDCPCTDTLQQCKTELKSLRLQLQEQQVVIPQLESERDALAAELAELKDALLEAEKRLSNANSSLNQLKGDTERRLREKDDEADAMR